MNVFLKVQEEAARQQVPNAGGFGKVTPTVPGNQMPPPVMQRTMAGHLSGPPPQQQTTQGGVAIGPGASGNLLSMDQWGSRYPNQAQQQPGLRPPNQNQMMQPIIGAQQPVSLEKIYCEKSYRLSSELRTL